MLTVASFYAVFFGWMHNCTRSNTCSAENWLFVYLSVSLTNCLLIRFIELALVFVTVLCIPRVFGWNIVRRYNATVIQPAERCIHANSILLSFMQCFTVWRASDNVTKRTKREMLTLIELKHQVKLDFIKSTYFDHISILFMPISFGYFRTSRIYSSVWTKILLHIYR